MNPISKVTNLSCDQIAERLFNLRAAASAAAFPYEKTIVRTGIKRPYYLHRDDRFCRLLINESTEMLAFIWAIIQLGEMEVAAPTDRRCPIADLPHIKKTLIFSEIFLKNQDQTQAEKERHRLLQKIIETPNLNACLMIGIMEAQLQGLFDEELEASIERHLSQDESFKFYRDCIRNA